MKVFFNASLHGKKEFQENYNKIFNALKRTDAEILAAPALEHDVDDLVGETSEAASNYYENLLRWIKQADIVFFEVSFPSTSIGYEIALALQQSKPVVAFRAKGSKRNVILDTIEDEKLQLIEYTPLENIDSLVSDSIEFALGQADTRFNFFISPRIAEHLDWISREKKVPRAVYLRQLIERDMMKNKEFNG